MKLIFIIAVVCMIPLIFNDPSVSQDTGDKLLDLTFKIEEIEKKPYCINVDIEGKETLRFLDKDALLFKQKYLDEQNQDIIWQTDFDLTIEGQYQKDSIKLYGRINSLFYYNDDEHVESERKVEEAYISFQPLFSLAIDAGKKVHKWGKGYAFSPSAFFSRPKDLDDPDAALEGYYSLSADFIKSREGVFQTIAITPVFMPVTRELNYELGPKDELIWGGKFYIFAYDTDMDVMFLISDNLDNRFGIDFSKNLSPAFEIHGDAVLIQDYGQSMIDEYGSTSEQEYMATRLLLGLRYLSSRDTTYIFEYYRNGQGYSAREYENYLTFIETGFDQYLKTSSQTAISQSRVFAADYNQQAAMKDYLYLKVSQKDPFDILYFTPAMTVIYNMADQSASITPQINYSPLTNLTLDLKAGFLFGGSKTEYGEKINIAKIVFAIKYYF